MSKQKAQMWPGSFSKLSYFERIEKFWGYRCAYCLKVPDKITKDHVMPKSRGGNDNPFNLVPSCSACNTDKGNHHPNRWCSLEQRNHIVQYFNVILHFMVAEVYAGRGDEDRMTRDWLAYAEARKNIDSTVKKIKLFSLLKKSASPEEWLKGLEDTLKEQPGPSRKNKARTVTQIIGAWKAGDVTRDPVHRAEQVRPELRQEISASGAVQDDDGDVWRTSDGLHILH